MVKLITPIGILIALSLIAFGVVTFLDNPMDKRREILESNLALIQPVEEKWEIADNTDFSELRIDISGNNRLWEQLILPPPPPPPRPPSPPDLNKMLAGVTPTKQSFGAGKSLKLKIITKGSPKGEFFSVGDAINKVKIIAIDKEQVTFGLKFMGEQITHSIPRP